MSWHKYDNNYQTSEYFIVELCPNSCLNGGQCFAENKCMCSSSYTGDRCENLGKKIKKIKQNEAQLFLTIQLYKIFFFARVE